MIATFCCITTYPAMADGFDPAAHLSQDGYLSGQFTQTNEIPGLAESSVVSKGEFLFLREYGLRWRVTSPVVIDLKITSDGVRSLDDSVDGGKFNRSTDKRSRASGFSKRAGRLVIELLGEGAFSGRRFEVESSGNISAWRVELVPKQRLVRKHLDTIEIQGSEFIETINMQYRDGRTTMIAFSAVERRDRPDAASCILFEIPDCSDLPND